jgi:hypothetical protein
MTTLRDRLRLGLAGVLLRATAWLLPASQAGWARAMRAEVLAIDDPTAALAFAWGCFNTAMQVRLKFQAAAAAHPDRLGLWCTSAAVLGGAAFMALQTAPTAYPVVNGLSLALAAASFALLPRQRLQQDLAWRAWAAFGLGALLLGAALTTPPTGWLPIGPVSVQPAWLLVPALWVLSASITSPTHREPAAQRALRLTGLWMGQLALLIQAQAGLLGVSALLLALRAGRRRSGADAAGAVLAAGLAVAALPRWTAPPPQPFVDEVLQQAFAQGPAWGLALGAAWLCLLLPGLLHRRAREHGLVWLGLLGLSLPGWLPAPVLGFGGSFILGYVLSLAVLPGLATGQPPTPRPAHRGSAPRDPPSLPRTGLA